MRKFADKEKICNTKEDYIALMKTLEKLGFHWVCGQDPTDETVMVQQVGYFPVKIYFGSWREGSKLITFGHYL